MLNFKLCVLDIEYQFTKITLIGYILHICQITYKVKKKYIHIVYINISWWMFQSMICRIIFWPKRFFETYMLSRIHIYIIHLLPQRRLSHIIQTESTDSHRAAPMERQKTSRLCFEKISSNKLYNIFPVRTHNVTVCWLAAKIPLI